MKKFYNLVASEDSDKPSDLCSLGKSTKNMEVITSYEQLEL